MTNELKFYFMSESFLSLIIHLVSIKLLDHESTEVDTERTRIVFSRLVQEIVMSAMAML